MPIYNAFFRLDDSPKVHGGSLFNSDGFADLKEARTFTRAQFPGRTVRDLVVTQVEGKLIRQAAAAARRQQPDKAYVMMAQVQLDPAQPVRTEIVSCIAPAKNIAKGQMIASVLRDVSNGRVTQAVVRPIRASVIEAAYEEMQETGSA